VIPFTDNSAHVTDDFCTERRLAETLKFIRRTHKSGYYALDIGEPNYVSSMIQATFMFDIEHTVGDLHGQHWWATSGELEFQTVFCFEVIEHVMNPLQLLYKVNMLLTSGGVLYLSTPVHNRFGFYFNETNHFTEYKESSLRTLVEYAGFRITDYHQFKSIPFWQSITIWRL